MVAIILILCYNLLVKSNQILFCGGFRMWYLISISLPANCDASIFPSVSIEAVSSDRDEMVQHMYDAFCATVCLIKGCEFELPGIADIGSGWHFYVQDISLNIDYNAAIIEHDGERHVCSIIQHNLDLHRLDADTWVSSGVRQHTTRIFSDKQSALSVMSAESQAIADWRISEACGPILRQSDSEISVDSGLANGTWRVSPVEIL
mgnify:CR=1 FL=1